MLKPFAVVGTLGWGWGVYATLAEALDNLAHVRKNDAGATIAIKLVIP